MTQCVFCRMIAREIPVSPVYEDEHVIAFDDIAPQAPVHTLIVPKQHVVNLSDSIAPELLAALFGAIPAVARAKGVAESGYRIIVNNGPDARQTVQHLHLHLIGGRDMVHGMVRFADD